MHPTRILPLALALLAAPFLHAQDTFKDATAAAGRDLERALAELSETREAIASEKIPAVREVSRLEDEVARLTREHNQQLRLRDNSSLSLDRLREQTKALKAQNEYVAGLLDEFVRSFETRVHFSESQLYAKSTEEARLALQDGDLDQADQFSRQLDVVAVAIGRLQQLGGGYTFEGKALAPSGEIEPGTFAVVGPSVYFSSKGSDLAGVSYNKLNAAEAAIAVPGAQYAAGIRALINDGQGSLPLDPTLGKAIKIQESSDTVGEHLAKGGVVGYVIVSLGVLCLIVGAFKLFEISRFITPTTAKLREVLGHIEAANLSAAKSAAGTVPGASGELLLTGVEHCDDKRGTLEEVLYERILSVRPQLERFLAFIAVTAAAAPLLGLLGTVTGMMKTFSLITIFGSGDAKSLASGISEALVTTELGLMVAIPALIMHGLLSRMAKQKLGRLEQTAVSFINSVVGIRHKQSTAA
ncbi:MAG: MotA/TolQ/ExbB proton channel family protein [Verrucomicrobiota bacterium]